MKQMLIPVLVGGSAVLAGWGGMSLWDRAGPLQGLAQGEALHSELIDVEVPPTGGTGRQRPRSVKVARYEVSFGEWRRCHEDGWCRHNPKMRPNETSDHPVTRVNWLDTQEYLAWLNHRTGKSFRLPYDSEWRFMAGDVVDQQKKKLFDDPRLAWAADYVNFGSRPARKTEIAGAFGQNRHGIFDLAGNVWEWTQTCWRGSSEPGGQERTEGCGGVRILQGLHRSYQSELIRVAQSGGCSTGYAPSNIGFRIVLDADAGVNRAVRSPVERWVPTTSG